MKASVTKASFLLSACLLACAAIAPISAQNPEGVVMPRNDTIAEGDMAGTGAGNTTLMADEDDYMMNMTDDANATMLPEEAESVAVPANPVIPYEVPTPSPPQPIPVAAIPSGMEGVQAPPSPAEATVPSPAEEMTLPSPAKGMPLPLSPPAEVTAPPLPAEMAPPAPAEMAPPAPAEMAPPAPAELAPPAPVEEMSPAPVEMESPAPAPAQPEMPATPVTVVEVPASTSPTPEGGSQSAGEKKDEGATANEFVDRFVNCTDVPPTKDYTCRQQRTFGKCNDELYISMNYCAKSCGRAPCKCTDVPPPFANNKATCKDQKKWGKCSKDWMLKGGPNGGWCLKSCGICSDA